MKKIKLLLAALLFSGAAMAQTDVTSTYLDNADFSSGTPVTVGVCTYAKDKSDNGTSYANLVAVDGWTAVSSADGKAGGLFAIGGGAWLGGAGYTAPATDSDGNTGVNVLGVVTCWSASVQYTQTLKSALPAGTYTLVLAAYNSGSGADAISKNLIGFKESGGTEHYATTTTYTSNTWKYEFITFTLSAETSGDVSIGYSSPNKKSSLLPHLFISGLTLFEGEVDAEAYEAAKTAEREKKEAKVLWGNAVAAANAALANTDYANVTGAEKTALAAEVAKTEPTSTDDYKTATTALTTATSAFTAAKSSYDALVDEIAYATALGVATTDAETVASAATTTAATALAAAQTLNAAEYTAVTSAYSHDLTESYDADWTSNGFNATQKGQHWDGTSTTTYLDVWSGSAKTVTAEKTITLPAGSWVLKAAGRAMSSATITMSDGTSTVKFPSKGDNGYGIDVDGVGTFSTEGTYANTNGRGWEWRYLPVTTTAEETSITITVTTTLAAGSWSGFCNFTILADDATYAPIAEAAALAAAQKALKEAIDAITIPTANIGSGAFQIPSAEVEKLQNAVDAAQTVYDEATSTTEQLTAAKETLNTTVAGIDLTLNAPADGQLFNVILTSEGWNYDNKAITYLAGARSGQGDYNIQYEAEANTNLAQAFTFTKVSDNNYMLSQIDADGVDRFICTGTVYGGNAYQIRTTTEATSAAQFTVIPTATEGVWNLRNVEANQYVGSQDAGVYTVNKNINFKLVETSEASVAVTVAADKYATRIFPFTPSPIDGVTFYACDAVAGNELTLTEVVATELKANVPYILYAEKDVDETLTGNATAASTSYSAGLLTGVYAETAVPAGSYVLQTLNSKQGFYAVSTEDPVNAPANRVYLTVDSSVKAFYFGGMTDAIQAVEVQEAENAAIYNLAGQRVQKAVKGIYVINGKKVLK